MTMLEVLLEGLLGFQAESSSLATLDEADEVRAVDLVLLVLVSLELVRSGTHIGAAIALERSLVDLLVSSVLSNIGQLE